MSSKFNYGGISSKPPIYPRHNIIPSEVDKVTTHQVIVKLPFSFTNTIIAFADPYYIDLAQC